MGILFDGNRGEPTNLREVVGQAIGAGSVCWESMAGTGVFESERARDIAHEAVSWIEDHYIEKEHHHMSSTPVVDELERKLAEARAAALADETADAEAAAGTDEPGYTITPAPGDEHELDSELDEPAPNAIVAFLVIVQSDGTAFATGELAKLGEILPSREANIVDMRNACQQVVHDVNAMQTAQQTVGLMQQQAQAMAEETRNAKIAAKLQSKGIQLPRR